MSVAEERVARSVALEKAYVHDVYEQFSDGPRGRPWPKVNQFLADLEPGSLVCDVGCGSGKYLAANPSVFNIGADKCIRLTKVAQEKENEVLVCDNLALPFRDESFDAVLSVAVVHHFATTERRVCALRELARILRIGGRLIISVWAMEQKHRKFESQDVLVPWHRPQTLSTPSLELTSTTNTSEEDVLPPYHAYTQTSDSDSNKSIKTKVGLRKRGRTRHKGRSIDPGRSSSPSSSSLSSPNETCYSFVRRAIQKLAGGKRSGTSHRPWFLDSWNSCTKEPPQKRYDPDGCENYDCGNVQDLPIELRRVDDEEPPQRRQTFPSSQIIMGGELYGGIKSKSLTDIKTFEDRWIVRSQSSVPSLQQETSQEEEENPPPPVEVTTVSNRGLNKPRLVKQKQSICEEDAEEALDKPTDMRNLVNALPEFRVHNGTSRHRGSVCKQRSMNEELMSTERLREKERVKRNIQKQASLNEDLIYQRHTLDTLRDSFFSVSTSKRFQLIKSGFTNTIKNSTTNIEKVAGSSLKNGFVRMFQGWKANEFVVSPTQSSEVPMEPTTNTTIVKPVVQSAAGAEEKKDASAPPGERRHSREDGSDSSKDSSLQSDTSVDSEDSFASVIFVPKTDPLSPAPLSPGPTSPRLKQTSVPNSPRMKQSSCPTSPRIKQMPLTVYPLTKQLSSPKSTTNNTPTTPTTITNINNKPNNTTNTTTTTTTTTTNKPSTDIKVTCARDQLETEEKTDSQVTPEPIDTKTTTIISPTKNTTKISPTTTPTKVSPTTIPTNMSPTTIPIKISPTTTATKISPITIPPKISPTTIPPKISPTKIPPTKISPTTTPTTNTNNNSNTTVTIVTSSAEIDFSEVRNDKPEIPSKLYAKVESLAQKYAVARIPKFKRSNTFRDSFAKGLTEIECRAEDRKRTERLRQIRELLNQRPGFGIRSSRSAFPIVRHSSTRSGGRIEAIARPLPRLLSLELFNPETDDKDSDSSGVSSPDSVDSVINIEVSENGQGTKSEDELPMERKTSPTKFAFPPVEELPANEVETLSPPAEDKPPKLSPTSMNLLAAAADVANSLDEAVDAVIQSSPRAKRRQLQPVQPKEVQSVMERQYNTDSDAKCPTDCPSDAAVIESTWDEECHKHLTDFADKLSEKLLSEIDQYQEQTRKQEPKEVKFDVPATFQHIDDPYIHRLSEELKDLNKLSAEIQKQNQYLSQLSKNDQVLAKATEQAECTRCCSKLCKCSSERIHSDDSDKIHSDTVPYYVKNLNNKDNNTVVVAETNSKCCSSEIVAEPGSKDKSCLVARLVTETTTTSDAPVEGNVVRNNGGSGGGSYHRLSRESSDASTRGSCILGAQHSVESNDMADISEMTTTSCGSDSQKETNSLSRYSNGGSTASLGSCTEWSRPAGKLKDGRLGETRRSLSQDKQSDDSSLNEQMLAGNFGSLNASLSDTSQDSLPSDNIGGAITYHRYYHVFREGELDQLIERYVENLHIISSYYDHASWCVVAEKVQVWTI